MCPRPSATLHWLAVPFCYRAEMAGECEQRPSFYSKRSDRFECTIQVLAACALHVAIRHTSVNTQNGMCEYARTLIEKAETEGEGAVDPDTMDHVMFNERTDSQWQVTLLGFNNTHTHDGKAQIKFNWIKRSFSFLIFHMFFNCQRFYTLHSTFCHLHGDTVIAIAMKRALFKHFVTISHKLKCWA